MSDADFLLELLSEEIPARMQARARNDLARMFAEEIEQAGLSAASIDVWSTPRRLALVARRLPAETPARREEVKGPRTGAPPQALEGFLRKTGLANDQLEERDGVFYAVVEQAGQPTSALLAGAVERIVRAFPWPKAMRWGDGSLRWVRPLHGIVAILGEEIVPVRIDGIEAGATSVGHRFHHPGPITIGGASDYAEKLRACHVIVDQDERERLIRDGAAQAAAAAGLTLLADEGLVVENAGLTEWPVPLLGRFEPDFLDVPREVIVLTMRTNQKYFAVADRDGGLAPAFVCIANIDATDGGAGIVEGNRRVLAARLADARFFWEQDLKVPLDVQREKLAGIVFHEKLGTVADKVERVAKLARWLAEERIVPGADPDQAERAARLAKADLVTGMVGEFPELQGIIGGYLARAQGEPNAVADAVRDHYKPVGQGDHIPTQPVSVSLGIAERIDDLSSFFGEGITPTSSKDPFALRRSALGLIRYIEEGSIRTSLRDIFVQSRHGWIEQLGEKELIRLRKELRESQDAAIEALANSQVVRETEHPLLWQLLERSEKIAAQETLTDIQIDNLASAYVAHITRIEFQCVWSQVDDLMRFVIDRLKVQQREAGVRHDLIDAVFALGGEDDLVRLLSRVEALQAFVATDEGADLLTAYKRAANILKREKWPGSPEEQGIAQTGEEDPLVLVEEPGLADAIAEMASGRAGASSEPHEQALIEALDAVEGEASTAVAREDFTGAMAALARLRGPIDAFFDHVTVNDSDPAVRERRLNLLLRFRDAVHRVADFSKVEG